MPDVYIARAGLEEEDIQDKMLNTNLEELGKENQELKTQFALIREGSEKEMQALREDNKNQTKLLKKLNFIVQVMLKTTTKDKKAETYFKKQLSNLPPEEQLSYQINN